MPHPATTLSYCRQPAQPEYVVALHIAQQMVQYLEYGTQTTTCRVMTQMTMMMLPTFSCSRAELLRSGSHPRCCFRHLLTGEQTEINRGER